MGDFVVVPGEIMIVSAKEDLVTAKKSKSPTVYFSSET